MADTTETQVLIAGAGPIGLTAAIELARRGIDCRIADPLLDNPLYGTKYYRASVHRLIGAIFLGASTDDANCLVLRPPNWQAEA